MSLTVLVTGGTGALGSVFAGAADTAGHRVRVLSRRERPAGLPDRREWARGDLVSGEGMEEAVRDVVYPSIVGADRLPYGYFESKVAAEELALGSDVPGSVVRITHFHGFVDDLLGAISWIPLILPLPTRARIQSIAVEEAAEHLLARVEAGPAGRATVPERRVGEVTWKEWLEARRGG